jgi:GDP-L-fucose synthase
VQRNILVTGGSGQVGLELKKILPNAIYLSSTDCDLTNEASVMSLMTNTKFDVVVHLAAKVGGILDNINNPCDYLEENLLMNTNILKWSRLTGVERFIGVLSTCIYPDKVDTYPMTEDMMHIGPPTATNFSYGYAKRCLAVQIDASNKQYGTEYQYLIPCNLYGVHDKFDDRRHFVAELLQKIHNAKVNNEKSITLFGTGTPLRQFMHAKDFADIIKLTIDYAIIDNFNVTTSENLSINKIAEIALSSLGCEHIHINYDSSKPDGQYRKDVSVNKLISYFPDYKFTLLKDGLKEVYDAKFN